MTTNKHFTLEEAQEIGEKLGVKFRRFDVEQFRMGMDVELEHGKHDAHTDVTGDDPLTTGKIALAHLNEFSDYYTRLEKMEEEAKRYHSLRKKVERVGVMAQDEFKDLYCGCDENRSFRKLYQRDQTTVFIQSKV